MTDLDVRAAGSPPPPAPRRYRGGRRVLVVALLFLLVPVVAVAGYAAYLTHLVSANVQKADLLPAAVATTAPAATATAGASAPAVPAAAPEVSTGTAVNYLLVGSDAGSDREGARADVIMLVHVPANRTGVTMVHFPRDMYVQIPGNGKDKINASFAYGGTPLLVRTVQEITGVHVDHVAMIGFEGFRTMTDAVGGVDVPVTESSARDGYTFTAGTTQHMDGSMALTFVRERYQLSQGDISRGERQQTFLMALMLKVLSSDTLTNPVKLASLVSAATTNLTIDQTLEVGDVQKLALSLRSLHGDQVRFITAPLRGFGTAANGASIDVVDTAKLEKLGQAIASDDIASYKG